MSSKGAPDPEEVASIVESAAGLPAEEATRILDRACGGDAGLRSEVERLLARDGSRLRSSEDLELDAFVSSLQPTLPSVPRPADAGETEKTSLLDLPDRYRDAGHIGRGGMGEVRAIRDLTLRREVAAKTLTAENATYRSLLQGFVEEAQVTAQLEHPNIVPVHELGTDRNGTLYFTMKRVQGRTLHELLADPSLPVGSSRRLEIALEVLLKVCDAVAFAHSRGVLHRDIKPANIMVGEFGEVYVMDWGLAKVRPLPGGAALERPPESPLAGILEGVVGTPGFLAPEMARRQYDRVDERSDVFGLGAVLYQIVTGKPPFSGESTDEILAKTAAGELVAPEDVGDFFVPVKLARIVKEAMASNPDERYATASDLAEQVREFLHRGMHLPRQTFAPGEAILREGEVGDCAYILTRGSCEVYRTENGVREVLRTLTPGLLFGEAAILASATRLATVEAVTESTVLVLTRQALDESFSPDSWEGLLARTLVQRFRELDGRMAALGRDAGPV